VRPGCCARPAVGGHQIDEEGADGFVGIGLDRPSKKHGVLGGEGNDYEPGPELRDSVVRGLQYFAFRLVTHFGQPAEEGIAVVVELG
jgi:hypothetical protein